MFQINLRPHDHAPVFAQVAQSITEEITRGRLRAGDLLPGTRTLARMVGIGRDTVLAAYAELEAQGWVHTDARKGTIVAELAPTRATRTHGIPERVGFSLDAGPRAIPPTHVREGAIALFGGVPDLRDVPVELLVRAERRALKKHKKSVLGYSTDPRGHERLRRSIARLVRENRGIAASEEEVIVTRGSQMALDLCIRAIVRPGDVVCVEALGYKPAWAALERAGAKLVGIPVDREGIDTSALEKIKNARLLYVTPHHQYPTTAILSAGRRQALLAWARKHRVAILEDDYDHEFHYEGRPVLPLASDDKAGVVVYIGTLSKVLAPGLRLGFAIGPRALVERLSRERFLVDRQGDLALELAVAELIEDDELGRHVRKMRRTYRARRDVICDAFSRELEGALAFTPPTGGMALWAEVDKSIDVEKWATRAMQRGVLFQPGSSFTLTSRKVHAARFGFACVTERELEEAARRLARAL